MLSGSVFSAPGEDPGFLRQELLQRNSPTSVRRSLPQSWWQEEPSLWCQCDSQSKPQGEISGSWLVSNCQGNLLTESSLKVLCYKGLLLFVSHIHLKIQIHEVSQMHVFNNGALLDYSSKYPLHCIWSTQQRSESLNSVVTKLQNLTCGQVLDYFIKACADRGIWVLPCMAALTLKCGNTDELW